MIGPAALPADLWSRLAAEATARARDAEPAHDISHVLRVVENVRVIARDEPLTADDEAVAMAAALLHELFNLPKDHPDSARAGDVCAEHARALLEREAAPAALVTPVVEAIRDHAFSKGALPTAPASRVLQDADRLDAIGAIGLARMWATCAAMKRPFYAPEDPFCTARDPDDKAWGLDHVYKKLLLLPARLHTRTARRLAEERATFMRAFLAQLARELPA
ncbi:MAG: metal-dependent phosphohydrolase [Labilithrix sp.]|nr:metal-dependent phosphohydrolase [Labilithrix sp.]